MHAACGAGHSDIAQLLCKAGAFVNDADVDGMTALHHAAMMGHAAVVRTLCAAGADQNCIDKDGWTPLHVALEEKSEHVVAVLSARMGRGKGKRGKGSGVTKQAGNCAPSDGQRPVRAGRRAKNGQLRTPIGNCIGPMPVEGTQSHESRGDEMSSRLSETAQQLRACARNDFGGKAFGDSDFVPFKEACWQWTQRLQRLDRSDTPGVKQAVFQALNEALRCSAKNCVAKRSLINSVRGNIVLTGKQRWELEQIWEWGAGAERMFGFYRCPCGNEWESGYSYAEAEQQCIKCNTWIIAYRFRGLEKRDAGNCKEHVSARCAACLAGWCEYRNF